MSATGFFTEDRVQHYQALLEFAQDVCHPEQYGHLMPPEVIRRAARLLRLIPREKPPSPIELCEEVAAERE